MMVCVRAVREKDLFCCYQVHFSRRQRIHLWRRQKSGGGWGDGVGVGGSWILDEQMREVAKQEEDPEVVEGATQLQMCKHALFRRHSNRTSNIFISQSLRWYQRIQRGGNTQETRPAMVSTAKTVQYIRRGKKEQGWTVKSVSGDRLVYLHFAIDIAKHHKCKQSTRFLRDTAASCLPLLHNCYLFVLTVFYKCKTSH